MPTGIATDDSTKFFFGWLAETKRLASLYDFENRDAIFQGVHRSYKFCLLTTGRNIPQAELAFFASQTHHLSDKRRCFSLSAEEFELINPNTLTCPVFRSQKDAELTKKIYRAAPVLIREEREKQPEQNSWGIRFQAMFHMSADSGLFHSREQVRDQSGYLPVFEAKMIHHFDHRWATYEADGESSRECRLEEKQNPHYQNQPRYWVPENDVTLRTTHAPKAVLDVLKKYRESDEAAKWLSVEQALKYWQAGFLLANSGSAVEIEALLGESPFDNGGDMFAEGLTPQAKAAQEIQAQWPLNKEEYLNLQHFHLNTASLAGTGT